MVLRVQCCSDFLSQWMKFCGVTASGTSPKRPRWGQKKVTVVGMYVLTVRQKRDRCRQVAVSEGSHCMQCFRMILSVFQVVNPKLYCQIGPSYGGIICLCNPKIYGQNRTCGVPTQTSLVQLLYCNILLLGFQESKKKMCEFFLWPQSGVNLQQQQKLDFCILGRECVKR